MTTVANSGAEEPAAMKVAPATSGDNFSSGNIDQICTTNIIKKKHFFDKRVKMYIIQ